MHYFIHYEFSLLSLCKNRNKVGGYQTSPLRNNQYHFNIYYGFKYSRLMYIVMDIHNHILKVILVMQLSNNNYQYNIVPTIC